MPRSLHLGALLLLALLPNGARVIEYLIQATSIIREARREGDEGAKRDSILLES